jgi:hypothetical protein
MVFADACRLNCGHRRPITARNFAQRRKKTGEREMPTLFRFVVTLLILAGIAYGVMFALVMFVEPRTAEISVRIPPAKLDPAK